MTSNNSVLIEVSCNTINDCITAQKCGADRIELVSAGILGGLTPSVGTLISVKDRIKIPVLTIIRPRSGGFCYTEEEFLVCCMDARLMCEYGSDGIVFGFLTEDGDLDYERCARFLDYVKTDSIVFHRAIDVVKDPFNAIEKLISLGVKRILTSGTRPNVTDGIETIKLMQNKFGNKIEILPGGGVTPENIHQLVSETGVKQVHMSSSNIFTDKSVQNNVHVNFGTPKTLASGDYTAVDGLKLKKAVSILRSI